LTISDDAEGYEDVVSEILGSLIEYADSSRHLTVDEILGDEQLDVSTEMFRGDQVFEPLNKYSFDEAAVYTLNGPSGFYLAGSKAVIDMSLPESLPSIY